MPRPRDSFRKRVLDSEAKVPCSTRIREAVDGSGTMQGIVPLIVKSRWWQSRLPEIDPPNRRSLVVEWAQTTKCAAERWEGPAVQNPDGTVHRVEFRSIELARSKEIRVLDVYHALAHHLHPEDTAWHGPEFCKALLDLVKKFDPELHPVLVEQFKADKVKTRTWSAEARERAKQRHAAKTAVEDLLAMSAELADEIEKGEWS